MVVDLTVTGRLFQALIVDGTNELAQELMFIVIEI